MGSGGKKTRPNWGNPPGNSHIPSLKKKGKLLTRANCRLSEDMFVPTSFFFQNTQQGTSADITSHKLNRLK